MVDGGREEKAKQYVVNWKIQIKFRGRENIPFCLFD